MADLRLGGLVTGIDTESLIARILDVSRIPITKLQKKEEVVTTQSDAVTAIKNSLSTLKSKIANLKDSNFFESKLVSSSDATIATATATSTAVRTTHTITISALAASSVLRSGTAAGDKIASKITSSSLLTANDSYGTSLTLGTFTVNGSTVTIDATDTLDSVLTKISTATSAVVTGTYSAATDKITLTSASAIVLGGSADTSDFLSRSRLYTNSPSSTSVVSLTAVGNIDTAQVLSSASSRIANYATLTTGTITVNGVSISVDKDVDTLQNVLDRITSSSANVYASYDSFEDRIVLTSKTTGSTGITVADGTGNFASKLKLTSSTSEVTVGSNATFTIDGSSQQRQSVDGTLSESETGIPGITITALKVGTATLTVGSDTSKIQTEVSGFVSQYNSVVNLIGSYTAQPTKKTKPTDTASILANDSLVTGIPNQMRSTIASAPGTGTIRMLEDLGVTTSSENDLLTFTDTSKLTNALQNNLSDVKTVFTSLMPTLETFIDTEIAVSTGALSGRLANNTAQIARLDANISDKEKQIDAQEKALVASFSALEEFQSTASRILQFLQTRKN